MYRAIMLDLDGTLLDTTEGVLHAVERTIELLGLDKLDSAILKSFVGPPMQLSFQKYYGMQDNKALEAANLFRNIYKEESLFKAELYPTVLDTLKCLKGYGYKMAIATNKSHNNAIDISYHFHVSDYCDYIQGSDFQGKLRKKDIILQCCEKLQCNPEDCVYVGDSIFDLEGAEKCHMKFIAVMYGFGFRPNEAIHSNFLIDRINDFSQLQNLLKINGQ